MAALDFPGSPTDGQVYPATALVDIGQWQWDAALGYWKEIPFYVRRQSGSYNSYLWPLDNGGIGNQLTTDGDGLLTWFTAGSTPQFQLLGLLEGFDGANRSFTLVELGTTIPYTPVPSTNLAVFLGGVPQVPIAAYTVTDNTITFTEAPLAGATFYALTTITTL